MSKTLTNRPKPTIEIINRFDELDAQITTFDDKTDSNTSTNVLQEYYNLMYKYDWYDNVFEENGKKGLKNVKGEVVVPATFDDILMPEPYYYPSLPAPVVKEGKAGLVKRDGQGTVEVDFDYYYIERVFNAAIYAVTQAEDKKHFALMAAGTVLTPYEVEEYYLPCDGCMIIRKNDKYGVLAIDQGLIYIAPEYDKVLDPGYGEYFLFIKDGVEGYVTLEGKFISKDEFDNLEIDEQNEYLQVGFIGSEDIYQF